MSCGASRAAGTPSSAARQLAIERQGSPYRCLTQPSWAWTSRASQKIEQYSLRTEMAWSRASEEKSSPRCCASISVTLNCCSLDKSWRRPVHGVKFRIREPIEFQDYQYLPGDTIHYVVHF